MKLIYVDDGENILKLLILGVIKRWFNEFNNLGQIVDLFVSWLSGDDGDDRYEADMAYFEKKGRNLILQTSGNTDILFHRYKGDSRPQNAEILVLIKASSYLLEVDLSWCYHFASSVKNSIVSFDNVYEGVDNPQHKYYHIYKGKIPKYGDRYFLPILYSNWGKDNFPHDWWKNNVRFRTNPKKVVYPEYMY